MIGCKYFAFVALIVGFVDCFLVAPVSNSNGLSRPRSIARRSRPLRMMAHGKQYDIRIGVPGGPDALVAQVATSAPAQTQVIEDDVYGESDEVVEAVDPGNDRLRALELAQQRRAMQQQQPSSSYGLRMPKSNFFTNVAFAALIGSGLYLGGQKYFVRQEALVEEYGKEMAEHTGDFTELASCHKDFKRKLGPGQWREEMFLSYVKNLTLSQATSLDVLKSLQFIIKKFRFSDNKVAKLLGDYALSLGKQRSGQRGKIFFLAERVTKKTPKAAEKHLSELRKRLVAAYRQNGDRVFRESQETMAEQALRESSKESGGNLPEGWELLGLTEENALAVLEAQKQATSKSRVPRSSSDDDEGLDPVEAAARKRLQSRAEEREADEAASDAIRVSKAASKPAEPVVDNTPSKAYECGNCGFTMYVAKGREWKFFPEDYKCPECGAARSKFTERDT